MVKILFKENDGVLGMHIKMDKVYTGADLESLKTQLVGEVSLMLNELTALPADKNKSYLMELPNLKLLELPRDYTLND